MTKFGKTTFAAAVATILIANAPALAQHAGHTGTQKTASDSPSNTAYRATHMKMMKAMDVELTGNADVDFVRGMIPHHQGAIDMAEVELAHGKDPALKKMAQKIIDDQKKEIAEMQDWLKKNGK